MYFYNARYYDPALGRFLQADSLVPSPANPQSLNRYSYVLNSPLKYTDPTGHRPCGEFCDPSEMGTTEETDLETGNTTTPLPNPVADPDPTPIPYTFTFPWWTQHTGQGRTVPMVTLEEDFWFSKIKLSHSARIEVDGTDRLRIHYDRIKIGPTTVEASGRVINKLFSYNLFEGRYVNEVNLVGYVDGWTLGIGVREDGKTMGPSTPTYSAAISQRLELDFEINLRRTAWALATVGIIYASRGSAVEGLKALPAQ